MNDSRQPEDVATSNDRSLKALVRAITLSQGKFRLILARCNYGALRDRMVQRLRELSPVEIREIVLPESIKSLYTAIKSALGDEVPQAVMVFGLDSVHDLRTVLTSSNYIREEFSKHFPFPLVLWINDEVQPKLLRLAPDLESWATSVEFAITADELSYELIYSLTQKANRIFARVSESTTSKFLDDSITPLENRLEIDWALKDLQSFGRVLEPEFEAKLQLVLGRDDYVRNQIGSALARYQQSLAFWRRTNKLEWQGFLLFHLVLCFCRNADHPNFQRCLHEGVEVFKEGNHSDLIAKFINELGEVLQKLEQWNGLETIAKLVIKLHEEYPNPNRLAYGYGLLAEVALKAQAYQIAEQYAYLALETNSEWSELACQLQPEEIDCGWSRQHDQNLYLLLLSQAQSCLGKIQKALKNLETAKAASQPQHDPSQYIRILKTLRSLYLEQGQYLEGFRIKQEQRLIEHQYGFRAFIGAGQLQPQCQVVNPAIAPVDNQSTIAQEIAASGRQQDLNHLLERISRTDCKLTVIYGPSGVGKSSLVTAGLVPALQQRAIGERDALPLVVRVYTNWINDLGQSLLRDLGTSLADALDELRDINFAALVNSPELILRQLRKNGDRNLLTVLIFDQIEEFFFVCTDQQTRCRLYTFLRDCLNIPYVKIILSLREDYLHYLLECERCVDLDIIDNNILDKKNRYYLGNFKSEDAKVVIESLNKRSQFYLETALINALVRDLAGTLGEVRPIELQVVGAQLQEEEITTLEHYQRLGSNPKEKLVERFLQEAIKDCGSPNARTALLILYLLTDENGTRPLKTRAELASGLEQTDLETTDGQLDLVLEILVKSGLLMLLPEAPADRYQLVHDYLVSFIRQKKEAEIGLEAALQRERIQRQLTEQQLQRVQRQRLQVTVAGLVVTLLAFTAVGFGLSRIPTKTNKNRGDRGSQFIVLSAASLQRYTRMRSPSGTNPSPYKNAIALPPY